MPRRLHTHRLGRQAARTRARGFGAIMALVVLVLLAALAAAIGKLSFSQQASIAQDVLGARALRAANSGAEWGLWNAFNGTWTSCAGASQTLNLSSDLGMRVTVTCSSSSYNEGQTSAGATEVVRVYTITAVACNSGSSCPDNTLAGTPGYVERSRQVQATDK